MNKKLGEVRRKQTHVCFHFRFNSRQSSADQKAKSEKQRDRSFRLTVAFLRVSNYWHLPFHRQHTGHIFKLFVPHSSEHKSRESLAPKGFQPKVNMTAKKICAVPHLSKPVFGDAFLAIFT